MPFSVLIITKGMVINMKYYKLIWKNNFILSLFYTAMCFGLVYIGSLVIASNDYNRIATTHIRNFSDDLTNSIIHTQDIAVLFQASDEIKDYVTSENASGGEIARVKQYLSTTISAMPSSDGVVGITNMKSNHIVTKENTMSFEFFCESIGLSRNTVKGIAAELVENPMLSSSVMVSSKNNRSYLTIIRYDENSFKNQYFVFCTYDIDKILEYNDVSGKVILMMNDCVIYYSGDESTVFAKEVVSGRYGYKYKTFERIIDRTNLYGEFKCYFIVPRSQYFYSLNRYISYALIFLTVIFAVSLYLISRSTNMVYAPLNKLMNEIELNDLEKTENELGYIKDTIVALNNKNSTLSTIVENYKIPLREKFMREMLQGFLSDSKIENGIKEFEFPDIDSGLSVIVFDYTNMGELSKSISKDGIFVLKDSVNNIFTDYFKDYLCFELMERNETSHMIIAAFDDYGKLKKDIVRVVSILEDKFDLVSLVVLGKQVDSWTDIPISYESCERLLSKSYYGKNHSVVIRADDMTSNEDIVNFDTNLERELVACVIDCDKEKLWETISSIIDQNYKNDTISKEKHTQLVIMLSATVFRVLFVANKKPEEVFGEGIVMYLELHNEKSALELKNKTYAVFEQIIDCIIIKKKSSEEENNRYVIEFVNQNYTNNISLIDLAEHMNMSTAYASRLFKKITGENFKDYLAKYRVDAAKDIIEKNPRSRLSDVAARVGFNNIDTFIRTFSKYEGMLPSQFKELHR